MLFVDMQKGASRYAKRNELTQFATLWLSAVYAQKEHSPHKVTLHTAKGHGRQCKRSPPVMRKVTFLVFRCFVLEIYQAIAGTGAIASTASITSVPDIYHKSYRPGNRTRRPLTGLPRHHEAAQAVLEHACLRHRRIDIDDGENVFMTVKSLQITRQGRGSNCHYSAGLHENPAMQVRP